MKLRRFALYTAVLACLPTVAMAAKKPAVNSNELINLTELNNDYIALRHGESVPSS